MEIRHILTFKRTQLSIATDILNGRNRSTSLRSKLLPISPVLKKYAAASLLSLTALTAYANNFYDGQFLVFYQDNQFIHETNDVYGNFSPYAGCSDVSCTVTGQVTLASPSTFFGNTWTAHDIRLFGPGSYSFDTDCTGEDITAGRFDCDPSGLRPAGPNADPIVTDASSPSDTTEGPDIAVTVGPDQLAGHILWDWGNTTNTHVPVLWDHYPIGTVTSIDGDGDGVPGFAMVHGPMPGFQLNFNLVTAPPAPEGWFPVCGTPTFSTKQDEVLKIDVADLLSACYSVEGNYVYFGNEYGGAGITGPFNPNSTITTDWWHEYTLEYTPSPGFTGSDGFEYTVHVIGDLDTPLHSYPSANISVLKNLGNFTMLDSIGNTFGGTNDVVFNWDKTVNMAESDTNFNISIASDGATPFFGAQWTAHHARVFGPGNYSFDSGCSVAEIEATGCPAGSAAASGPAVTMSVGAGQLGAHLLFDYSGAINADIVNVWDIDSVWNDHGDTAPKNRLWSGAAGTAPDPASIWQLVSRDVNGDGINGSPMVDGPFTGFYAIFNKGPSNDSDSDSVTNSSDNCPVDANPDQIDSDSDNVGDACDLFPQDPSETLDSDGDGVGDNADAFPNNIAASVDADNDGKPDEWNAGCDLACQDASGLTLDGDSTPDQFSFTDQAAVTLNTLVESNTVIITGLEIAADISVTGGEYSINGGAFTSTSGLVNNGDSLTLRTTSASLGLTAVNVILTIDTVSDTFTVTSRNNVPNPFSFISQIDVALYTLVESNAVTISGLDLPSAISISGGEYSINGAAYTSGAGTVSNGDQVSVRHTSSSSITTTVSTVLTVGDMSETFSSTTSTVDTIPDAFSFVDQTGVAQNTLITSSPGIVVSGINTAIPISVAAGEYSINGGAFTSNAGLVNNGDLVIVRHASGGTEGTKVNTVLSIGIMHDTFSSTTYIPAILMHQSDWESPFTPTYSTSYGNPEISPATGIFDSQSLAFNTLGNSPSLYYDQIKYNISWSTDNSYQLSFDIYTDSLVGSDNTFTILLDTPFVRSLMFKSDGTVKMLSGETLTSYNDNEAMHIDMVFYIESNEWVINLNNVTIYSGSTGSAEGLDSIRFSLGKSIGYGSPDHLTTVYLDNVTILAGGPDTDGDGVGDNTDSCPVDYNPDQVDSDGDNVGDACDLFPLDPTEAFDSDGDGVGDNADAYPTNNAASVDTDNDGSPDTWNTSCDTTCQSGSGLIVDTNDDNDGYNDTVDNCTLVSNNQLDTDGDGYGNACDSDFNNDGIVNSLDIGPFKTAFFNIGSQQTDINGDNIVNSLDLGLFKQQFSAAPGPSGLVP